MYILGDTKGKKQRNVTTTKKKSKIKNNNIL